ncbi:MAG: RluA family pseudouridine synthase [Alphaproteobacteria bacterium]|nr:RluA family pseudouridine synthase [Alphaproteobacteria bacterium]
MLENTVSILISGDHAGQRLDRFLNDAVSSLSRTRIKALIESGYATINGQTIEDPNFRVKPNTTLTLTIPEPVEDQPEPQKIALDILYEDDQVVVLNKPAGLVVHPGAGNPDKTLVNALLAHCGDSLRGIGGVKRPGIVHRIDKDTSGLMIVAKTDIAHREISAQFSAHTIERRYDALIWGVPSPLTDTIEGAIGRSSRNRKKMAVVETGGKEAKTHYQVIASYGMLASHVSCQLETGRTHQIRVHMTGLGHSLIGDQLYGRGTRRGIPDTVGKAVREFKRQALHAATIGFSHPTSHKDLRFEVRPPEDFETLKTELEQYSKPRRSQH